LKLGVCCLLESFFNSAIPICGMRVRVRTAAHRYPRLVDRCKCLKVRVERDTGELRHLRFALLHDLLEFLGAELASICANEYAIIVILWHTFLLSTLW
jgi:hypothetical protein